MAFLSRQDLVLMPGLDGTGKSFEPILPLIAEDARVTVIRYPANRVLSFDETVECAMSQIPENSLPVIIAESFSGPVAVRLGASGRGRIRALVMCATFVRAPRPLMWRIVRFLRLPLLIGPDMPRPFFKFVMGDDSLIDALLPLWKKVHAGISPRVMEERLSVINRIDVTADLSRLSLPCLFLQATDDRVIPSSCLADMVCRMPHLVIEKIQAPHFILQARPHACLAAIEDFLKRVR